MKINIFNFVVGTIGVAFILGIIFRTAGAVTIVNTVQVESSTGGQTIHGQNGVDGIPGQAGDNESANTASTAAIITTTFNGQLVENSDSRLPVLASPETSEVVVKTGIVLSGSSSSGTAAVVDQGVTSHFWSSSSYEQIQEIFNNIHNILLSYVDSLF